MRTSDSTVGFQCCLSLESLTVQPSVPESGARFRSSLDSPCISSTITANRRLRVSTQESKLEINILVRSLMFDKRIRTRLAPAEVYNASASLTLNKQQGG